MLKVVGVLVLLVGGTAFACSCPEPMLSSPPDGATHVPINVVIQAQASGLGAVGEPLRLRRVSDRREVALEVSDGHFGKNYTPTERLEANTGYEFSDGSTINTVTFTTGEGEDLEPPSRPTLEAATYDFVDHKDSCGQTKTWALEIRGGLDARSSRQQGRVLVSTARLISPSLTPRSIHCC